jgi:GxxExxY protein
MDTNEEKLLLKDEVFQIVGCAIEVLNTSATGSSRNHMKMRWWFGLRKIPFRQQPSFDVLYKGQRIGLFVPDLIAFDLIVVDAKVIDRITDHERGLMLNYLQIANLRVGIILNFKRAKLEWERIVS